MKLARSTVASTHDGRLHVLITGVSPFEDLPGYQFYSMLKGDDRFEVEVGDDSEVALEVLRTTGAHHVHLFEHPGQHPDAFVSSVRSVGKASGSGIIVPGADAHLFALARAKQNQLCCPAAAWLAKRGISGKRELQSWVSTFVPVPRQWDFDHPRFQARGISLPATPIMLKGRTKGAHQVFVR